VLAKNGGAFKGGKAEGGAEITFFALCLCAMAADGKGGPEKVFERRGKGGKNAERGRNRIVVSFYPFSSWYALQISFRGTGKKMKPGKGERGKGEGERRRIPEAPVFRSVLRPAPAVRPM